MTKRASQKDEPPPEGKKRLSKTEKMRLKRDEALTAEATAESQGPLTSTAF